VVVPEARGGSVSEATAQIRTAKLAPFVPAAAIVVLWLVWIGESGGYFEDLWYPSAFGATALLLATLLWFRQLLPRRREARIALLAFAALTGLNYLSILWSGSKGAALVSADKLLLYLLIAWIFAVAPWTPRTVVLLLGTWSVGVVAFCAIGLLQATSTNNLDPFFVQLRYATPLDYPNATAALAVMGLWPALILSTRSELWVPVRAVLLAISVFLCEFALLPQSRGGLVGMVVTAVIAFIVTPGRLRLLVRYAVLGGGLALSISRTVNVDDTINAGKVVGPVLSRAATTMLLTSIAALVIGLVIALIEDRIPLPRPLAQARSSLNSRNGRIALAVVAVLAIGGASVAAAPQISRLANKIYHSGKVDAATGSSRIFSITPEERVDYIRVALHLFSGAPLLGVGAADFGRRYDGLKRFSKHSQYVHDISLRTLSETGIVGLGLFLTAVLALTIGLALTARRLGGLGRACATAAFMVAAYFLAHASLDWLDEFPALAAPALSMALAAIEMRLPEAATDVQASPDATAASGASRRPRPSPALILVPVLAVVAAAAAWGMFGPYIADRYVQRALKTYGQRPSGAYHDLSEATSLFPLSADPAITEGTAAEGLGDSTRARAAFVRALGKEDDWYSWLQLALIDSNSGHYALALSEVDQAAKLDVDDPLISEARTLIVRHQAIDPVKFNQLTQQGPNASLFKTQNIK
jgi:O-Antigen ligase